MTVLGHSNRRLIHRLTKGDTLTSIQRQLMQDGQPVNLTGLSVKFEMRRSDGTVKLAATATGVSVVAAALGKVQFDFPAAAVDEAGEFAAYFIVESGAETDHYPHDGPRMLVRVYDPANP